MNIKIGDVSDVEDAVPIMPVIVCREKLKMAEDQGKI